MCFTVVALQSATTAHDYQTLQLLDEMITTGQTLFGFQLGNDASTVNNPENTIKLKK